MEKVNFKRYSIIVLTVIILTCFSSLLVFADTSFTDVKTSHWAYNNIVKMNTAGIVKGYPDGTFKPSSVVTYAEFIKMAVISITNKDSGSATSGHWAMNYYNDAIAKGMFTATDIPTTDLNKSIPRKDMALIISNLFDKTLIADESSKITTKITDIASAGNRKDAVIRAYGLGIITGYVDGTFRPDSTLTRAESCAVIVRLTDESVRVYPVYTNTYKLSDLVNNLSNYPDLAYKDTYTLENASKYNMQIVSKNGVTGIYHYMKGYVWLVKDGKVIEEPTTAPADTNGKRCTFNTVDITTVDYIVAGNKDNAYDIIVVANPFKN